MTDWDEQVRRVKFRMRETVDVGTTPDFSDPAVPDLKPVDPAIVHRIEEVRNSATTASDPSATTETEDQNTSNAGSADTSTPSQNDDSSAVTQEPETHRSTRSRTNPATVQRETLLLEIGDMMVYLFQAIRIRSARLMRFLGRSVRSGANRVEEQVEAAMSPGRDSSTWLVYLLVVVFGLGLLLILLGT